MSHPFGPVRTRRRPAPASAPDLSGLRTSQLTLEHVPIAQLPRAGKPLRRRSKRDFEKNAASMEALGFAPPVLIDRASRRVLHGEGHLETYRRFKRELIPVIWADGLSPAQASTVQLWLAGFDESGEFDPLALRTGLEELLAEDPDLLGHVFFDPAQIDSYLLAGIGAEDTDAGNAANAEAEGACVTRPGDVWVWPGGHRAICGNSRFPETYAKLMNGAPAQLLCADPPYGVAVADISRRHGEWIEGSGMSEAETTSFLTDYLIAVKDHLAPGALVYNFIDAKGMFPLLSALRTAGLEQKQICTWDKGSGVGGFYMNVCEHVVIAKHGKARHVFNRKNGFGSTLWSVPGYASFRPDREEALAAHACTKPQGVLMPILLAASKLGDIVLDAFLGSGSGMLSAERTRRRCYGVELDPRYVDTTVRRMHALTGAYPTLEASGLGFAEVAAQREAPLPEAAAFEVFDV